MAKVEILVFFSTKSYSSMASSGMRDTGHEVLRQTLYSFSYKFSFSLLKGLTVSAIFASGIRVKMNSPKGISTVTTTREVRDYVLVIDKKSYSIDRTKGDVFLVLSTRIHLFLSSSQHSRSEDGRLWPIGHTENLFLLKHFIGTQLCPDAFILSMAASLLQRQGWIIAIETVHLTKSKTFTTQLFTGKVCHLLFQMHLLKNISQFNKYMGLFCIHGPVI